VALAILPTIRLERSGRISVPGPLTFLGGASYSIYLAHGLAISVAMRLIPFKDAPLLLASALGAGLAGGIIYYLVVEKPMIRLARRIIKAGVG
jgi:exopolysaccharide production protein ExoZ